MRTITAAQRAQVAAGTLAVFARAEVTNPDGAWTDLTTGLSTPDWFTGASLSETIDQPAQTFRATVARDAGGTLSLAPLRTDSTVNRNGANAYAPMLDVRRQWRVFTGVAPAGSAAPVIDSASNVFTAPRAFADAAWAKNNTTIASGAGVGADNRPGTAWRLQETTATGFHELERAVTGTAGQKTAIEYYVKAAERTIAAVWAYDNATFYTGYVDLVTGAVYSAPAGDTLRMTPMGGGWWRLTFVHTHVGAAVNYSVACALNSTTNNYAGDATKGILVWGAQAELNAAAPTFHMADWVELGRGTIDTIDVPGSPSTIQITGRDGLAPILDGYIQTVQAPYSAGGADSMETVIQQILDDTLGTGRANVGSSGFTLYTPVATGFTMNPLTQGVGNLYQALQQIAQLAGFVVRMIYDATDVPRLTLVKPPRSATVADWTIGPGEYTAIPQNALDLSGVRNLIDLWYVDPSLGQGHVTSPSTGTSTSITDYGRRYMRVNLAGSLPMTAANAQAMADAICSDLQTPWLTQQLTSEALWFAQLFDFAKTLANGVQYNTDQTGGVTSVTHTLRNGTLRTTLGLRGQPAGGYRTWLQYGTRAPAVGTGPNLTVTPTPGASSYSIAWSGDSVTLSIDGGAYQTPPASPISVARSAAGGADHVYAFQGVKDGQTVTDSVTIPAIGAAGTVTPDLTVTPGTQTATAQPYTVSATNPGGSATPAITVTLHGTTGSYGTSSTAIAADTATTIASGDVVTVTRPAFASAPATVTFRASLAGGGAETIQRTVLNQDAQPAASISGNQTSRTQSAVTLTLNGAQLPAGYTWKLYKSVMSGGNYFASGTPMASGSSTATPLPTTINVTASAAQDDYYSLIIYDASGKWAADDTCTVKANQPALTATGAVDRTVPMGDGGYATRATDATGYTLHASVQDSRASLISNHFRLNTDTIDSALDGTTFGRTKLAYLDANRPHALYRSTAGTDVSAELLGSVIGADAQNLVTNGGGQDGALGAQAPGWTYGSGSYLVPTTAYAKLGDRSLCFTNAAATDSTSYQDVAVAVGDVLRVSGWIKIDSVVASGGYGAALNINHATTADPSAFTALDRIGPGPSGSAVDVGPGTGTSDWTYYETTFRANVAGTVHVYCQLGYGGNVTGTAYFDGVRAEKMPPNVSIGGYRGSQAIDGTNIVVPGAVDFTRGYTNKHLGNIPDDSGSSRFAVSNIDANRRALIDFTQGTHVGKTLANIPDDSGSGRFAVSSIDVNRRPIIDFTQAHVAKHLGNIPDDSGTNRYAGTSTQIAGGGYGYTGLTTAGRLKTGVEPGADLAGVGAARLASSTGTSLYRETFETDPVAAGRMLVQSGQAPSLVTGVGRVGPNVAQVTAASWLRAAQLIPYNPSRLYRIKARVRQAADGGTNAPAYLGVMQYDATGAITNNNSGLAYVCFNAAGLTLAAGWIEVTGYFTGASAASTTTPSNSGNGAAPSALNTGTVSIAPTVLLNWSTGNGTDQIDYIEIDVLDEDASARTYGALASGQQVAPGVTQGDAVNARPMMRGYQIQQVAHGGPATFSPAYANIPKYRITGGIKHDPRNVWGATGSGSEQGAVNASLPQIEDFGLDGLGTGSATVRARLLQPGTTAAHSDAWTGTTQLTYAGQNTSNRNPASGTASDDTYTAKGSIAVSIGYDPSIGGVQTESVTVALDVDPTNTGAWTEVGTMTATCSSSSGSRTTTTNISLSVTRTGLTASSQFRFRIKTESNPQGTGTFTMTASSLDYTTATGNQYASATNNPGLTVTVETWEGASAG